MPLIRRWKSVVRLRRLQLVCFLLGIAVGLMGTAWVGRYFSANNMFSNFGRLHPYINLDSYFYPTARELLALAKELADKSKVNVILGGSSVMYGVGQPVGYTIADNLRRGLGDGYRVINLATRGGDVVGFGSLVSEALIEDGYRVIFIPDVPLFFMPGALGAPAYRYFLLDFYFSIGLPYWGPREEELSHLMVKDPISIGAFFNSFLNFNELWNAVHYKWVFTFPTAFSPRSFWLRRGGIADPEVEIPDSDRYSRLKDPEVLAAEKRILNSAKSAIQTSNIEQNVTGSFERMLPDALRKRTIVAYCDNSPRLIRLGGPELITLRRDAVPRYQRAVNQAGFEFVASCTDMDDADYIDRTHLSPSGAKKMADKLVEAVTVFAQNHQ